MKQQPSPAGRTRREASLASQLVWLAVLPALLASVVLIVLTTRQHLRSIEQHTRSQAQAVASQIAAAAQQPLADDDRRALRRVAEAGARQPHIRQVAVWSPDGELLARVATPAQEPRAGGLQVTAPVPMQGVQPGQVTIEIGLDEQRAAERGAWLSVLLAVAACLAGVLVAGAWAARRIGAPIRELARAVRRLGAGQPAQVSLGGAAEVRQLQQGFNAAAATLRQHHDELAERVREATAELARKNQQIEHTSQAKTRLLAAASHDLRQPLYALALFSDGLARGETDPARLERIRHVRDCVASLDQLFAELLNISQIDAGVLQPRWSDFALDRVLDDVSRNFRPVAEERHLRLVVRHTDLWVHSDYFMLVRIVGNLVANALRHTHQGGVLVAARRRAAGVRIDVVDTGVGIEPVHQQRIFEEFYQVEPADRAAGLGLGLGLTTVQRLADLLGAGVRLTSTPGRGTWVRVELPYTPARLAPLPQAGAPAPSLATEAVAGTAAAPGPEPAPQPPGEGAPMPFGQCATP
jgi:signal transduction histidine kinase